MSVMVKLSLARFDLLAGHGDASPSLGPWISWSTVGLSCFISWERVEMLQAILDPTTCLCIVRVVRVATEARYLSFTVFVMPISLVLKTGLSTH